MSLQALSDYTIYSRYAHYIPERKRRETWDEITERVFGMHERKYKKFLDSNEDFKKEFDFAKEMFRKKRVLGSQRALQFGGKWIEKENLKIYNCSFTHVDRPAVFSEIFYALLCGVGVGFSVQFHHVANLPKIKKPTGEKRIFKPEDSISGWADCIRVLLSSFCETNQQFQEYYGHEIEFDYSAIRPEGSLVAGQFKAPGYKGLEMAINKIKALLDKACKEGNKLKPIHCYDLIMFVADATLSGGIRRSATICLFSKEDIEMMNAKTGNWYIENPQRGRSNNSVVLKRDEVTKEEFSKIFDSIKEFGEPGFYFTDDLETGVNPCVEINMYPKTEDGRSGFQGCNLSEINGKFCNTKEHFYDCCRAASIIGTLQAGYTDFNYLSKESMEIFQRESLLGVSLTGWMDNPDILFKPDILEIGASIVKEVNKKIARYIGIRQAARTTCVKPSGSASCVLETASGIHPHHARRYIRNVQVNKHEFAGQHYKKINPIEVVESAWSAGKTDNVISFLCEVPKGAILKNDLKAVDLLERVKLVQTHWVEKGTNYDLCLKKCNHNVSNTITVNPTEWGEIEKFIFDNKDYFTGISLLSGSGDLDYRQAPFTTVLNEKEMVEKYGHGTMFASGLIVDALAVFDGDLFSACEAALDWVKLPELGKEPEEPKKPSRRKFKTEKDFSSALLNYSIELNLFFQEKYQYTQLQLKHDWVRRAKQFAKRYFDNDIKKMTYCLKHVDLWKRWLDMKREHTEIDWSKVIEDNQELIAADTLGAQACAGGKCSL